MSNDESSLRTPEKKKRRLVHFNEIWKEKYNWISRGKDDYNAKCSTCNHNFTISHGGENDVRRHLQSKYHIANVQASASTSKISKFFVSKQSKAHEDVAFAEVSFCYHSVIHSHSYVSAGCTSTIFKKMFPDSEIAAKYSCGKTKISAIISKIIGKHSKLYILNQLKNNRPFSISTDASNKGNVKTFPLIVRYFDHNIGVKTGLLSFISLEAEDTKTISNALTQQIAVNELSVKNITAYGADNANINFGRTKSVFVELNKINGNIIPAGCNLHILHNTAKKACNCLSIDIESIIIKIYNEFSSSTKKTTELKEFFEWTETEWSEMLRHVPTRWLTLLPAIERLLTNLSPIKSYFMSKNNIAPILKQFFENELYEAYLKFAKNVCTIFQPALKKHQGNNVTIVEVYSVMESVRQSLFEHNNECYYGANVNEIIKDCDNLDATKRFKMEANNVYNTAIRYIEK